MKVISVLNKSYRPTLEIDNGKIVDNPEVPERLELIESFVDQNFEKLTFKKFPEFYVYQVHPEWYVKHIKKLSEKVRDNEYIPEFFLKDRILDSGTPIKNNTYFAALEAVNASLTGANALINGEKYVYVLTRPPGHHATVDFACGYCYFNNAAIAAQYLLNLSKTKICIFDIDFHHGNGTQEIFYENPDVLYISIHGDPEYYFPWVSGFKNEVGNGKGKGSNYNFPLPGKVEWNEYKECFEHALEIITLNNIEFLIVSLGFDTHKEDPVGDFNLDDGSYRKMGNMLKSLNIPILFIQEGGYNPDSNYRAAKELFYKF
ncbi:histone deacetylase family protein [Thermosipho ferrireducens]|uniref:Histone deacetylase family protein n=1 Tax=Thermosipho ferrireducens TaxID=2571116 RepID=A0ABX7S9Z4_9BACT|nr:histone deacetylase family protein [Thermosipho ferrireducens]QTA38223.1 histone deacetylase family protein [Thermosipho ferrireducens]